MRKNPFAKDVGILTEEEILYVETKVLETFRFQLQARKIFPIRSIPDAKFTRFYDESDPSEAGIDMDGKAQSDDFPEKTAHDIKLPVIHKEFLLNWRDIEISRRQGPSILEDSIRTATRMVAEAEDRLLISGECLTWGALGIEGLFGATGRGTQAAGAWPANAVHDINDARAHLQGHGFVGIEPVLIGPPALVKCLDGAIANTGLTWKQFLLDNNLVSAIIESSNAYVAADCGQDSVLLVIPGEGNFWAYQGVPLTTYLWPDKMQNIHGTVRETIAPSIGRPEAIFELTAVVCT